VQEPSDRVTADEASDELSQLRRDWLRLLPRITPDNWRDSAGGKETVADLFAGLIAELDLASSPNATPQFALEFVRRRIAHKLSRRYSPREIGTELERRYERTAQALMDDPETGHFGVVLQRVRERVTRLRERLEG